MNTDVYNGTELLKPLPEICLSSAFIDAAHIYDPSLLYLPFLLLCGKVLAADHWPPHRRTDSVKECHIF